MCFQYSSYEQFRTIHVSKLCDFWQCRNVQLSLHRWMLAILLENVRDFQHKRTCERCDRHIVQRWRFSSVPETDAQLLKGCNQGRNSGSASSCMRPPQHPVPCIWHHNTRYKSERYRQQGRIGSAQFDCVADEYPLHRNMLMY
jgi:hypothetical protein